MKRISAIFLISLYLLSATELHELLKVDVLMEHFHETQKERRSVSFFEFLVMHYFTDDGNKKDDKRDDQLPFKSHNNSVVNNFSISVLNKTEEIIVPAISLQKINFCNYRTPHLSLNFYNNVWHPPKLAEHSL